MTEKEGLARAQAYCAAAEHCRSEVRGKLEKMELEPEQITGILNKLEKEGFINELRYARALVHDKLHFTKWGRLKISMALRQKKIPDIIARQAIESIDNDEYMAVLRDVVQSKLRITKGKTEYERRMKVMCSVISRGFETQLINGILKIDIQSED